MSTAENGKRIEDVIIVGSGPAGYTAALYTARADLEPLVIEGFQWGGLLQQTTDVENYPGYPEGVMGPEMMQQFRAQAERFGTRFVSDDATRIELSDGGVQRVFVGDDEYLARSVVLAMGAEPKKLGVPGEDELASRGVSYCATCDAAFFRDKPTLVVGGGDTAMEDATFLAKFASNVKIVHRRGEFRASAIMLDRARETDNIELVTPYVIERFEATDGDGSLGRAVLANTEGGEDRVVEIDGAFIAVGHRPNSELVEGQVDVDQNGYVLVDGRSSRTKLAGVFAAGDLIDPVYRQAVTAAGSGCAAALDAEAYLRDTPLDAEAHWTPDPDKVEAAAERAAAG
ncbi:MAG TPA: thioredoxin-disulfide reductase [Thermoleophilaceae bacterium]|nr:thioredoxin-disulfide reductase [Thermoleophilaceae bacterium]